ncbi:MAG: hypothetical protein KIT00_13530 [Rhodospirillales bacterium]|nr:hypothetical protein [Rhodospirillales bacterium]
MNLLIRTVFIVPALVAFSMTASAGGISSFGDHAHNYGGDRGASKQLKWSPPPTIDDRFQVSWFRSQEPNDPLPHSQTFFRHGVVEVMEQPSLCKDFDKHLIVGSRPGGRSKRYGLGLSIVPLPTALPMFATAIAGLGVVGWRRRKTA